MNLILILTVYGLNAVSFNSVDENVEYNDNDIFILNESKANLYTMYKNKKLDGVFVLDIQNSRFVSSIVKTHQSIFINFDLEQTIFDGIFSNYYSKKKLQINDFYSSKIHSNFAKNNVTPKNKITYYNNIDLEENLSPLDRKRQRHLGLVSNLGEFNTSSIRNVLISNDSIGGQIVYDIVNIIMRNNNFLLNKILYNKFSNSEHGLFEPVDIIYIDKNIRYHKGSRNFYEQMKFLTFDKKELTRLQTEAMRNLITIGNIQR